ncbi:3D domain-containing protein (plasmid) [Paenibacillus sp. EC2-1]|uniref:3D domain-containing protein n=1 Tax=Paenibacillus sp. EC2-1 TaxID=3388665 RepID=UPI003BEEDC4B
MTRTYKASIPFLLLAVAFILCIMVYDVNYDKVKAEDALMTITQQHKDLEDKVQDLTQSNSQLLKKVDELKSKETANKQEIEKWKKEVEAKKKEVKTLKQQKVVNSDNDGPSIKLASSSSSKTYKMEATAYTARCAGCSGITKLGIDIRNSTPKLIAVDPNLIKLGSKVELIVGGRSWGTYLAGDIGGDIKGHRIDVLMSTKKKAKQFGRRFDVYVRVIEVPKNRLN